MSIDLDAIDARLDEIGSRIYDSVGGATAAQVAVLKLVERAMDLRHAAMSIAKTSPVASLVILRVLVDLAILVRWIELRPRLHVRLWAAEGLRNDRQLFKYVRWASVKRGKPRPPQQYDAADAKRIVCRARALAVGRGVVDPESESLLPSIWARAKAIDAYIHTYVDREGAEDKKPYQDLYSQALDHYSAWTHSGSNSLRPTLDRDTNRRLSASVMAGLLASVSRQRGLEFGEELDTIRAAIVEDR